MTHVVQSPVTQGLLWLRLHQQKYKALASVPRCMLISCVDTLLHCYICWTVNIVTLVDNNKCIRHLIASPERKGSLKPAKPRWITPYSMPLSICSHHMLLYYHHLPKPLSYVIHICPYPSLFVDALAKMFLPYVHMFSPIFSMILSICAYLVHTPCSLP